MKKSTLIILIISIVIILVLIAFLIINVNTQNTSSNNSEMTSNVQNTENQIKDGKQNQIQNDGTEQVDQFSEENLAKWESLIIDYYDMNSSFIPEVIQSTMDQEGNLVIEIYQTYQDLQNENLLDYFKVDKITGKVTNKKGNEVNLEVKKQEETSNIKSVKFNDNACIAIGYLNDKNEFEFAQKYFSNENEYNSIKQLDMRTVGVNQSGLNKFIIIPKDDDVKITVRTCVQNENGENELDQIALKDHTGCLALYTDEIENVPKLGIQFEYKGYKSSFLLSFNGYNNKLDLTGNEAEVMDISIY